MPECNNHNNELALPPYDGKKNKRIVILHNRVVLQNMRQIIGIDGSTGKVVNIVDEKGARYGLTSGSAVWKDITVSSVIQGMFRYCPILNLNTLKIEGEIQVLGRTEIEKLRIGYKQRGEEMDFVSSIKEISVFSAQHPKVIGHAVLYFPDAKILRRNEAYVIESEKTTVRLFRKYIHDPGRIYYRGFAVVRFLQENQKLYIRIISLCNRPTAFAQYHKAQPLKDGFPARRKQNATPESQTNQAEQKMEKRPAVLRPSEQRENCRTLQKKDKLNSLPVKQPESTVNIIKSTRELKYLIGRNVTELIHFTHVQNLPGILKMGLLPRNLLPPDAVFTDADRLDGHSDCTCLSISFPNYKMFYRKQHDYSKNQFVVISVSVELLSSTAESDIAYFPCNAASLSFRDKFSKHTGLARLWTLFEETPYDISSLRSPLIPPYYTTNPQAEMLVRGSISPGLIKKIYVYSQASKEIVESIIRRYGFKVPVEIKQKVFIQRIDHAMWETGEDQIGGLQTDF